MKNNNNNKIQPLNGKNGEKKNWKKIFACDVMQK